MASRRPAAARVIFVVARKRGIGKNTILCLIHLSFLVRLLTVPLLVVLVLLFLSTWELENMRPRWDRAMYVRSLTGDDLVLYRNKAAWTPADEARFGTIPPTYTSGEGIKRELGKDLRSEEGKARLKELTKLWTKGLANVRCRNALAKEGRGLTITTKKLRAYELVEKEKAEELMGMNGKGDGGGGGGGQRGTHG